MEDQIIGSGASQHIDSFNSDSFISGTKLSNSTLEQINYIKGKPTNYVFLFGKSKAGKTAIASSLIYHLHNDFKGTLRIMRSDNNVEGESLARRIKSLIETGRFPDRTSLGTVTHIDMQYKPHDPIKKAINVSLLEMSGEDLSEVVVDKSGKLTESIEVFFKAGNISMIFVLVTSADEALEDTNTLIQFLDYLFGKDEKFYHSRIILLISQWDKYFGATNETVIEFVERKLRSVYAKIYRPHATNAIAKYSIGEVEPDVDGRPYIKKFDHESPEILWAWLYETITGSPLVDPPKEVKQTGFGKFRNWFFGK